MILQKSEEQVSFSILSCNIGQFSYAPFKLLAQVPFDSAMKMEW